ncbi:cardiolipin synthase [Candidatus Purcelliella pentastirinorum]|uniref:cardiolipin synthase n=1 Tax=Candidatus Purcelliella pentastirinorum TaxID=472834 RepID=UPI00237A3041|nr:cardiolipin synthase [Candidatus Purcelliella pentastirinorum]WDR80452.1 cardiolipin synthase [Candidatus Purcelliella pentastirinorum]
MKLYTIINALILLLYWILVGLVTLRILMKKKPIPSTTSWLLTVYILPIIGILVYIFLIELNVGKKRTSNLYKIWLYGVNWINNIDCNKTIFNNKNSYIATSIFKLCKNIQGIPGTKVHKLKIFTSTNNIIKKLIKDILSAKNNIEIMFYIWQPGGIADKVAEALIIASCQGIHCRLMLDSAGSSIFFRSPWVKIMKDAGIEIVETLKINILKIFLRRIDLRQHRKIIIIDNYITYTGSMNLVDPKLFKKNIGIGEWIDLMVRMEGPIAISIGIIYACDWELETGKKILPNISNKNKISHKKKYLNGVQIIASGPGFSKDIIHQVLLTAIYSATKKINITTPYFVPSNDLLNAICSAAKRGVKVNIIIPYYNDSMLVNWVSKYFFTDLLSSGVNIYQFKKGLLHTKSILIDHQLSFVGTANLDMRSLWLNFEITLAIDDHKFSETLSNIQKEYIKLSKKIKLKKWDKRSYWYKLMERLLFFFHPLL